MVINISIHIVPIGLDSPERFVEGFKRIPPSKVFFFLGKSGDEPVEIEANKIKEHVEKSLGDYVERETINVDPFDFSNVMGEFAKIIRNGLRSNKNVYINVSSSTKIVNVAAYMSASLFSARLYYIKAETYLMTDLTSKLEDESHLKETMDYYLRDGAYLSKGAKGIVEIPVLKMNPPSKDELKVLKKINDSAKESFESLKELVINCLELEYNGTNRNKYSLIVRTLEKNGFLETDRSRSRNRDIKLTESGKVIASISDILEEMSD
ncbi:hypothetical protein MmarC5_1167 [Methanococcus maripaludis C5]|uniref:Uncharacterized protein n=2 Tax=Methanococcus maripaludis TaxID=39152 RepID=A4FZ31_METM5|nr:DUF6293 family protein [Methanococcus maripaludis]ABO35465.1 hypothetical protein MmarC5_1167 [Methanococcus maripaludis C5]MBA2861002.1 hypothetical protein [Methanococcus maripaludis]